MLIQCASENLGLTRIILLEQVVGVKDLWQMHIVHNAKNVDILPKAKTTIHSLYSIWAHLKLLKEIGMTLSTFHWHKACTSQNPLLCGLNKL